MRHGGLTMRPVFAPSVGRYYKGMIVEVPLHLDALPGRPTLADIHAALAERYAGERFVAVAPLEESAALTGLQPEALNGTNHMKLYRLRLGRRAPGAPGRAARQSRQGCFRRRGAEPQPDAGAGRGRRADLRRRGDWKSRALTKAG